MSLIAVFVGINTAKEFGGTPVLGGAVAAIIVYAGVANVSAFGQKLAPGQGGVLGALGAAAVLLPLVVLRSARHRAPVIELGLFRARSFAVANAGMFAFSTAFYALLLCNVLFLTGAWGYSILEAGFAVTPGPIMAALTAPVGGRLADRFGQRLVALPGALLFATGCALFATGIDATPDYAGEYLVPTEHPAGGGEGRQGFVEHARVFS
jgi:nitrate/nitrite transporter NarK